MGTNTTIAISAVQWENIGDIKTSTFKKTVNIAIVCPSWVGTTASAVIEECI